MTSTKRIAIFIASSTLFMETIDATILTTATPAISHSFSVSPLDLKFALISYCITIAIFVPASGWFADKYGAKKVLLISLALFTLSSLLCGFSNNLIELSVARALQGIGGSAMLPVSRLIILRVFEKHEIIKAISYVAMIGALGSMLGPILGGVITQHVAWNWIFWANIPIGIIIGVIAHRALPKMTPHVTTPLDIWGFLLFGVSIGIFTLGLLSLSESTLPLAMGLLLLLLSFILLAMYFLHSRTSLHPIIKTELFRFRSFRVSMIGNLTSRLGFGGIPFLLPILLQTGLNYSAQETGLLLAPWAIGILIAKPFTLRTIQYFGYKRLLVTNTLLLTGSIWSFITINAHASMYLVGCLTLIYGLLISLQYSGMNSLTYAEIPPDKLGPATSILSTLQQLTLSFGVAITALFMRCFSSNMNTDLSLSTTSLHQTLFAMGVLTLLSTPIFLKLHVKDGRELLVKSI